jgi:cytochrome c biogenesis protein ResB
LNFNIYFDLQGPAGTATRIPNKNNPVTVERLSSVLDGLSSQIDQWPFGLEVIGVHIEKVVE